MSAMRVSAVFIGLVVDIGATVAAGMVWGIAQGFYLARQGLEPEAIAASIQGEGALLAGFAIGLAGTFLGGHVAARMGRHAPLAQGLGVGIASIALGALYLAVGSGDEVPTWYHVAGFVTVVPAALLGAATVTRPRVERPVTA